MNTLKGLCKSSLNYLSRMIDIPNCQVKRLKCEVVQSATQLGLDPTTEVFRLQTPEKSIIIKKHFVVERFSLELLNLTFLNSLTPQHVPDLLLQNDEDRIIVLEDVGDVSPVAADICPISDHTVSTWRQIMMSLAVIHSSASNCSDSKLRIFGQYGGIPKRQFFDYNEIVSAIVHAMEAWTDYTMPTLQVERVAECLRRAIRLLENRRSTNRTYAIGERSVANIRLLPKRICHIDHCCAPGYPEHADLVSMWRSPIRHTLLQYYIDRRISSDKSFDVDSFIQADFAFSLLNSLLWVAIKTNNWKYSPHPIPTSPASVWKDTLENMQLASNSCQELGYDFATDIFQEMINNWYNRRIAQRE